MAQVQRFESNRHGRDFIAGDIHGCFDQLEAALARVHFAPGRDRLFAVGDLVDRGPNSSAALAWMDKSWFHSCRGNHEVMRIAPTSEMELNTWLLANGGEWWFGIEAATRDRYIATMTRLPLALEVATIYGRVGIVHADVSQDMGWIEFIEAIERDDPRACEDAVWSRARAEGRWHRPVSGIDRVVCGHTIMADGEPHTLGNAWFIDTGAFLFVPSNRLTVLPVNALFGPPAPLLFN